MVEKISLKQMCSDSCNKDKTVLITRPAFSSCPLDPFGHRAIQSHFHRSEIALTHEGLRLIGGQEFQSRSCRNTFNYTVITERAAEDGFVG